MKGTLRRGRTTAEDRSQRNALRASPKQRAENIMIVDMVRNDLGRIADVGTVDVPDLFVIERYPNVWQMTSLVTAHTSASLVDIFRAMHPSASVTGAPKISTMEILRELEGRPRGVYTGAVGHISADGSAHFNVAIRTAVVDSEAGLVEFGIGSGIVWDSSAAEEYDECLLKGSVFATRAPSFELLETLRWTPGAGFLVLGRHLDRLRDSADYFGFNYREDEVRAALEGAVAGGNEPLRVRLLLADKGGVHVEHISLRLSDAPLRVRLAREPVDANDVFLFHKTTNRDMYNRRRMADCDETILWNEARQVTEAITANVVVEREGSLVTPPVGCGLLAGTFRAELLREGTLRESIVTVEELATRRLWLINSVHEWRSAVLETQ
jgi:para-aminobenzoate synthetase/4-amino-4-deoxychorismate lyase